MIPNTHHEEPKFDTVKNKRDQYIVEIRKKKNEDMLNAKRFKLTSDNKENNPNSGTQVDLTDLAKSFYNTVAAKNFNLLGDILESIRRAISMTENPPIKSLIATGVCPLLAELLDERYVEHVKVQMEASWILTNIASGEPEDTAYAVKLGIIPRFVALVMHPDEEVAEQALWALANISGDSQKYRDEVLDSGFIGFLLERINGKDIKINYIRNMAWLISNLCRGKPYPEYNLVRNFLPLLKRLIVLDDDEVLVNTLWSFSYLSDGENDRIQAILDLGVTAEIAKCLTKKNQHIVTPCLRTIGNMITGNDQQTEEVLATGVLTYLSNLLTASKRIFRKEACWTISNILAGTYTQIQAVIDEKTIIGKLIQLIYNDDADIKQEALFSITNFTYGAVLAQIQVLVESDTIEVLNDAINASENAKVILTCLEGLENILKQGNNFLLQGQQMNPYLLRLENCGGVKTIERLQHHPDPMVYAKISLIIEEFFNVDEPRS